MKPESQENKNQKRESRKWDRNVSRYFLILSVVGSAIFLTLAAFISSTNNIRTADSTSKLLLNEVTQILTQNKAEEETLEETLKADYISRAKTVARFLEEDPSLVANQTGLKDIAELVDVDEIHIFNTSGKIYAGTVPDYYGLSISSGEQMAFFEPMLTDKTLSLCQDITPNTAEGRAMMYAMTWEEDGSCMVQVGIEPNHLYSELNNKTIADVIDDMPMAEGLGIYAVAADTGEIVGATDHEMIGLILTGLGLESDDFVYDKSMTRVVDGSYYRIRFCRYDDYAIGTLYRMSVLQKPVGRVLLYVLAYILAFLTGINFVLNALEKNKRKARAAIAESTRERDEQFEVMRSMSEMYYSMHLLDLKNNTYREYNAKKEVSDLVFDAPSLKVLVDYIMAKRSNDVSREDILEFCDLDTLPERMRNTKSMYRDFHGTHGHWCRCTFITITADEEGYPLTVVIAVQAVEAEKRREEKLLLNSRTDSLTSCLNRRAFEEAIEQLKTEGIPEDLVYVSMDLNGLKTVNDTLGHAAGDELIIGAANCMQDAFGKYGHIYRTGGDEFIALLNADESAMPGVMAELEKITAAWTGEIVKKMTIASGYVTAKETTDIKKLEALADQRMYEAKSEYYRSSGVDRRRRSGDEYRRKSDD